MPLFPLVGCYSEAAETAIAAADPPEPTWLDFAVEWLEKGAEIVEVDAFPGV